MAWLTDWSYRKSITLSRASGAVSDYQMKLLVGESSGATGEDVDCGGHCAADFDDIRFTTTDGETLLDYWIESISGTTPNQLATIWIEFNSIGTGATTFYMYYGNAGAAAYSNIFGTFYFADDFTAETLNGQWTQDNISGPNSLSLTDAPGYVRLKTFYAFVDWWTGVYSLPVIWAAISPSDNYEAIASVNVAPANLNYEQAALGIKAAATPNTAIKIERGYYATKGGQIISGTIVGTGTYGEVARTDTTAIQLSIRRTGGRWYLRYKLAAGSWTACTDFDTAITTPQLVLAEQTGHVAGTLQADWNWVFIKDYLATEPAWGSWGSEELEEFEEFEDAKMYLYTYGYEYEDAKMYLYTHGYEYDDAKTYLATCLYEYDDATLWLQAVSSIVTDDDAMLYLTVTDGVNLDDCSLFLVAVGDIPSATSGVYHRLTSIISEV